jgi:GNAT superfamily N-acetyltransferase
MAESSKNTPILLLLIAGLVGYAGWTGAGLELVGIEGAQTRRARVTAMQDTLTTLQAQIDSGYEYFWIQQAGAHIGYAAIRHYAKDARVFISKLYLLAAHRKSGAGRKSLEIIEQMARERGATHLWLTVNKGNPSVRAYERLGFQIAEAFVADIGGGYVMDDYKMERAVAPDPRP